MGASLKKDSPEAVKAGDAPSQSLLQVCMLAPTPGLDIHQLAGSREAGQQDGQGVHEKDSTSANGEAWRVMQKLLAFR